MPTPYVHAGEVEVYSSLFSLMMTVILTMMLMYLMLMTSMESERLLPTETADCLRLMIRRE
jgi:hypothetical protein